MKKTKHGRTNTRRVGPRRWRAQNFAFFPFPATVSLFLCLSGCLLVEFWLCLKRRNLKCARLEFSGCRGHGVADDNSHKHVGTKSSIEATSGTARRTSAQFLQWKIRRAFFRWTSQELHDSHSLNLRMSLSFTVWSYEDLCLCKGNHHKGVHFRSCPREQTTVTAREAFTRHTASRSKLVGKLIAVCVHNETSDHAERFFRQGLERTTGMDMETCLCNTTQLRAARQRIAQACIDHTVCVVAQAAWRGQALAEQVIFQEDLVADVGSFETSHHPARSTTSGLYSSAASAAISAGRKNSTFFPHLASPDNFHPTRCGHHRAGASKACGTSAASRCGKTRMEDERKTIRQQKGNDRNRRKNPSHHQPIPRP